MNNKGKLRYFVGRKEMMKCGQTAEILEYIDCHHLRVRFEDGTELIREPISFERREVRNPNIKRKVEVGIQKTNLDGLVMTVIEIINLNKLKIRFEDGTEKFCSRNCFVKGTVMYPGMTRKDRYKSSYLGQIYEREDGRTATCVDTIDKDHLIIEFDTGERKILNATCFKRRTFLFPGDSLSALNSKKRKDSYKTKMIGMVKTNKAGLEMVCVDVVDRKDLTVRFTKSGYETHCRSNSFMQGTLIDRIEESKSFVGRRVMQLNGLTAECVEYMGYDASKSIHAKYKLRFDDGYTIENKGMKEFMLGRLKHPKRPMHPAVINGVKVTRKAFMLGTEPQMCCVCQNCGWEDIASFDEIYAHKCEVE